MNWYKTIIAIFFSRNQDGLDVTTHFFFGLLWIIIMANISNKNLYAQKLRPIEQDYIKRKSTQQLWHNVPATQLIPDQKAYMFSLMVDTHQAKFQTKESTTLNSNQKERLEVKSLNMAPIFAYSKQFLGIGLVGNFSENQTQWQSVTSSSGQEHLEASSLRYQGIGIQVFYNPLEKHYPLNPSLSLTQHHFWVNHKAQLTSSASLDPDPWQEYHYEVERTEIGAHLDWSFLSFSSLIPWVQTTYTYVPSLDQGSKNNQLLSRLNADQIFYLNPGLRISYGLDFAIRIAQFELHLGNLIHNLFIPTKSSPYNTTEHSYSVSILFRSTQP